MKFTVQYLDASNARVRYSSDLDAESAWAAETSARIGFRWARNMHGACCYRVLDATGATIAIGPNASVSAKLC